MCAVQKEERAYLHVPAPGGPVVHVVGRPVALPHDHTLLGRRAAARRPVPADTFVAADGVDAVGPGVAHGAPLTDRQGVVWCGVVVGTHVRERFKFLFQLIG